jgi:hypothetical protein
MSRVRNVEVIGEHNTRLGVVKLDRKGYPTNLDALRITEDNLLAMGAGYVLDSDVPWKASDSMSGQEPDPPEPDVPAPPEPDVPAPLIVDWDTAKSFSRKKDLETYAKELGFDLDRRQTLENMVIELEELWSARESTEK